MAIDLSSLNPPQREATTLPITANAMILSGAGTGKTRVLTHRIGYLIEQGIHPSRILAITFTNKAAAEMRQRLEVLTGKENADQVAMGTFHSIGLRFLRRYAHLSGYPHPEKIIPLDDDDALTLFRRVSKEYFSETKEELKAKEIEKILSTIISWKDAMLTPASPDLLIQAQKSQISKWAFHLYEPYESEKLRSHAVDFSDMLFLPVRILVMHPEVRASFQSGLSQVLVDEYQDTNAVQSAFLELVTDTGKAVPAFVVGDDDQSIYGFRGATPGIFKHFMADYPDVQTVLLQQNYRSTSVILDAANAVIANNEDRIPKQLFTENEIADFIEIQSYPTAYHEAQATVDRIVHMIKSGQVSSPDHIAILFRKGHHSRGFEQALIRARVPYHLSTGTPFYARQEIKDLMAYMRLTINPHDDQAFARAVRVPARKIGAVTVDNLLKAAKQGRTSAFALAQHSGKSALAAFCQMISAWSSGPLDNPGTLVTRIIRDTRIDRFYLDSEKERGEERVEHMQELVSAAFDFHHSYHMGGMDASDFGPVHGFITEAVLNAEASRKKKNQPGVRLMTVHKSKGLEFPVVFIPVLEHGEFPSRKAEDMEEERRLFYVAITRARQYLYLSLAENRHLSWSKSEDGGTYPSGFLKEIPLHLFAHPLSQATPLHQVLPGAARALPGARPALEQLPSGLW